MNLTLDQRGLEVAGSLGKASELEPLIAGLSSPDARRRFGSAKKLRTIAAEHPELLYPFFDVFVALLEIENKILQWEGSIVLSHLARVDTQNKFRGIFKRYFAPVSGPIMISAANVINGAARIAKAQPALADRIAVEVLKVRRARYATVECRNVAIGHAITAFGEFFDLLRTPRPVIAFVRGALRNPRPATAKKAARFLKKLQLER